MSWASSTKVSLVASLKTLPVFRPVFSEAQKSKKRTKVLALQSRLWFFLYIPIYYIVLFAEQFNQLVNSCA